MDLNLILVSALAAIGLLQSAALGACAVIFIRERSRVVGGLPHELAVENSDVARRRLAMEEENHRLNIEARTASIEHAKRSQQKLDERQDLLQMINRGPYGVPNAPNPAIHRVINPER